MTGGAELLSSQPPPLSLPGLPPADCLQADVHITAVFVDPTANHILVSTRSAAGVAELHYAHRRWPKSRPLARLKGNVVTAVAWVRPTASSDEGPGSVDSTRHGGSVGGGSRSGGGARDDAVAGPSDTCTGPIVLGTEGGALLEVVLDERAIAAKKEPSAKLLLQLPDSSHSHAQGPGTAGGGFKPSICSVRQEFLPYSSVPGPAPAAASGSGTAGAAAASTSTSTSASSGVGGLLVLVTTPAHLYAFAGGATLEAVFAPYAHARPSPSLEAVSPSPASAANSKLHLYYPSSVERAAAGYGPGAASLREGWPSKFAWLVGGIVYHGELDAAGLAPGSGATSCLKSTCSLPLPGAACRDASSVSSPGMSSGPSAMGGAASRAVPGTPPSGRAPSPAPPTQSGAAPPSPHLSNADGADEEPPSLVMTAYHFIVLSGDQIYAVNRVSGRVVAEVGFRSPITRNVGGDSSRSINGLVKDDVSGTMYVYSDESLYEVAVLQEARDMWRVYLQQQQWELALRHCSSAAQRDEVHCAKAEAALAKGDLCTAAVHFAKVIGGRPPFEDIALRLVEAQQQLLQQRDTGVPGGSTAYGSAYAPSGLPISNGSGGAGSLMGESGSAGDDAPDEPLPLFLSTKLSVLGRSDRAQATMVAAWLTELYLDQVGAWATRCQGWSSGQGVACCVQGAMLACLLVQV